MGGSSSTFNYENELMRDTTMQSVIVNDPNDDKTMEWGPIHRNMEAKDSLTVALEDKDGNKLDTLYKGFQHGVSISGDRPCLGWRSYKEDGTRGEYKWKTYKNVEEEVKNVAKGLASIGVKKSDCVGICSENRPEWSITSLAIHSASFTTVPLYDTLGENAVQYILNHSEAKIAIVSKGKLKKVLDVLDSCPKVTHIILFDHDEAYGNVVDTIEKEDFAKCEKHGKKLMGFTELIKLGKNSPDVQVNESVTEDLAFIMYTSGTTGLPKGVMITHGNVVAALSSTTPFKIEQNDVHLSYLPLAHIFETCVQGIMLLKGGKIGFYQGNVKLISNDICELRPTLFFGVPRIYSRIYDKVMSGVKQAMFIKRWYFNKALRKQSTLISTGKPRNTKYDKKIFSKVAEKMGLDRCRFLLSGAAPLPPYLAEFLGVAVNPEMLLQGYGMTENCAAIAFSLPGDHRLGHCGPPCIATEVRLADVPEMNYSSKNNPPTGEILVRGGPIFKGYYKNKEATKSTLRADGWMHTGDIGRWNPNGTLSIIDRKKNIFKLAQGEYIASEKIELVYSKSGLVNQIWLYGNSYKPFCVGVVVPAAEPIYRVARIKKWWPADDASSLGSVEFREIFKQVFDAHYSEIKELVKIDMGLRAKEGKLKGFERLKDFIMEGELDEQLAGFNVDNDCLTPTFKLRRPFLLKRYVEQIKELYKNNGHAPREDEKW